MRRGLRRGSRRRVSPLPRRGRGGRQATRCSLVRVGSLRTRSMLGRRCTPAATSRLSRIPQPQPTRRAHVRRKRLIPAPTLVWRPARPARPRPSCTADLPASVRAPGHPGCLHRVRPWPPARRYGCPSRPARPTVPRCSLVRSSLASLALDSANELAQRGDWMHLAVPIGVVDDGVPQRVPLGLGPLQIGNYSALLTTPVHGLLVLHLQLPEAGEESIQVRNPSSPTNPLSFLLVLLHPVSVVIEGGEELLAFCNHLVKLDVIGFCQLAHPSPPSRIGPLGSTLSPRLHAAHSAISYPASTSDSSR